MSLTPEAFQALRTEFAQVRVEHLRSTMQVLFDGLSARIDSYGERSTATGEGHARRIDSLDIRVTAPEHRRKPR